MPSLNLLRYAALTATAANTLVILSIFGLTFTTYGLAIINFIAFVMILEVM